MTINQPNIIMQPGEGTASWVLGDLYTFKVFSEDTNQAYALIEIVMQPDSAVPPHKHTNENESFYIQEGEVEFQIGEQIILATPGTFLHFPQGQPHSFRNINTKPAKFLCWLTPGGLEKFFREVGTPILEQNTTPPPVTEADINKLLATAPKYGLEILPTPAS
ncbi:quercetin 2,3-dioxygenase [Nostoc sp. LEGE 06077]|uniref:quercetin 2,3-dioxygenase n=1 Tax=Nostoc sp. LEGE 06077 TaxID=915325 RepID=UPI00187E1FCD|nr:quercetin 2,3-dioxygenase [Nostoc sp. LEGE 06077]MBE9205989.1 quercetin 2,3-dioxygenase [Nostoc sp. LEGE 06077]